MWNCSSDNVRTLVDLVHSGLVVNGEQLMCSNSTLVTDIIIEGSVLVIYVISSNNHLPSSGPTTPPSTPTPTLITPTPHPTLTPPVLPTSSPLAQFCIAVENSGTVYGFLDWPAAAVGDSIMQECPHGPEGGVASRKCGEGGEWERVEGMECNLASATTNTLITIAEVMHILEKHMTTCMSLILHLISIGGSFTINH